MKMRKIIRFKRRMQWLFGVYLRAKHISTVKTWNGLLSFDSKDRTLGRSLHVEREFERELMINSVKFLKDKHYLSADNDGMVLDVGGYIGMSSIGFINAGIFSSALVFEANPNNFNILKKNIKQNNLSDKMNAFNIALSDRSSVMQMELSDKNYGDHRVRDGEVSEVDIFNESERRIINVESTALDDFLSEHKDIDVKAIKFVWMDIQGFEGHFLQGAKNFFKENKNVPVCMEFTPYMLKRVGIDKIKFTEIVSEIFSHFYIFGDKTGHKYSAKDLIEIYDKYDFKTAGAHLMLVN